MIVDKAPIWEQAPELHHYTGWKGLHGIVTTSTLWATHYTELNDFSEIRHFQDRLVVAVTKKVKVDIIARKRESHALAMEVTKKGGALKIARQSSKQLGSGLN